MAQTGVNGMPVYESHPPAWLPKAHESADLGYAGFHPPRPGQDEDVMSQTNVKNGFVIGESVPAETFSAQDMIKSRFTHHEALTELEDLMNEIFIRRVEQVPAVPASSFRMPSRVTLNDSKRQAWFADLANPDVPLYKLGKNVPHGAKGQDLLDLLQSNNVAIPRAVWFLRVFGANETAGLRNKPSYNPTQYSVDWANVVTGYLRKQLADIVLPSAPRPGLNIKSTFKSVLAETDSRERWVSRFVYCLQLLRTFYAQGLVDNKTFLIWLVQTMANCNLAQAGFVARLADEYLDGMLTSRPLAKPFVDACLAKLVEINVNSAQEYLPSLKSLLETLLQRVCIALPSAFVSPRIWSTHCDLIIETLTPVVEDPLSPGAEMEHPSRISSELYQILTAHLLDIRRRNDALLFRNLPKTALAHLGTTVMDIQLLNSISITTDMTAVSFFDGVSDCSLAFTEKLGTLLTWSITPLQFGDHRIYAAATLLRLWRDRFGERAIRRDTSSPDDFIQDQLFDWLDGNDVAGDDVNLSNVACLFGKLVKDGLFQYAPYVQRLVARGEPGLSFTEPTGSRHRKFLRCIPLHNSTSSLVSQRKVTLHGARARQTPEDQNEREIRKEIRLVLPQLFGGESRAIYSSPSQLLDDCHTLMSASRFEQVRTFRQWLMPIFRKSIESHSIDSSILHTYSIIAELLGQTKCYGSILELNLFMLQHPSTPEMLTAVIETIHRYFIIWTSMNAVSMITHAIYSAHQAARMKGIQSRALLMLLEELDTGRYLDSPSREHVAADFAALTHALHPESETPDHVPDVLPEILLLAEDNNPDAPALLANSLWYKYRTALNWAWKVWDNTVASLRQVPVMTVDPVGRQARALRYGRFLLHVDQHLPGGFDDHILQWFMGTGRSEVSALCADAWDVMTSVLLYLIVNNALETTSLLRGLVYPTWETAARVASEQEGQSLVVLMRATNDLVTKLLLHDTDGTAGSPPADLVEVQRLLTRRKSVYREPHFSSLLIHLPTAVCIENNPRILADLRQDLNRIRGSICEGTDFRMASHRNLDAVRSAFEQNISVDAQCKDLSDAIIDALRMTLDDSSPEFQAAGVYEWRNISSLLSPWRLAVTTVLLQFTLRQTGRMLAQESSFAVANEALDKLTGNIFHHSMTSEEAFFVAEMARGADGAVACKFINNGIRCMKEILSNFSASNEPQELPGCIERAGQLLRVLTRVAESSREEALDICELDPSIQNEFINIVSAKMSELEAALTAYHTNTEMADDDSPLANSIIFLCRLLHFDLGLRGAWTTSTRMQTTSLVSVLSRIAMLYGSSHNLDISRFLVVVDTLYCLFDEIADDPKSTTYNPFRNYPSISISEVSDDLPPELRDQFLSLLAFIPPEGTVTNLATAHRDPSGHLVVGAPVLNRPWEWIENLGEPAPEGTGGSSHSQPVKNTSSIALELFNTRATGDEIVSPDPDDPRIEANIRSFEDGLSSENIFKRDWRETRTELVDDDAMSTSVGGGVNRAEDLDELGGLPTFHNRPVTSSSRSRRTSPASASATSNSARSQGQSGSARSSPLQPPPLPRSTQSSMSDPIDVDALPASATTRSAAKRKMEVSDDDEVEIIDAPPPPSKPPAGKRPRGKTVASKTRKR